MKKLKSIIYRSTFIGAYVLFLMTSCEGPEGLEGPVGADGADGEEGVSGADGADGADGSTGETGAAGNNFIGYFNDFEECTIPDMTMYGDADWFCGIHDLAVGTDNLNENRTLLSGDILDDQLLGISIEVNNAIASIVEFDAWISSEATFDYLTWSVNGTILDGISGIGGPFHFTFELPVGDNIVAFEYSKDEIAYAGNDNTNIDNIHISNFSNGKVHLNNPELPSTVNSWNERGTKNK